LEARGQFIFYTLADEAVLDLMSGLRRIAERKAVAALRARGFKVRRLEDGLPEWCAAGLPILTGNA
jgi:hypothetical protein